MLSCAVDGFAFFETVEVNNELELPFVELTIDGDVFNLQNGFASMFFAAPTYWLFDLPAKDVNLNYEDTIATTVKKTKIQEIDFPSVDDQNPMKLLISSLGTGRIRTAFTHAMTAKGHTIRLGTRGSRGESARLRQSLWPGAVEPVALPIDDQERVNREH